MVGRERRNARATSSRRSVKAAILLTVLLSELCYTAHAETLYDAFNTAFASNAILGTQRAAVRVGAQDRAIAATGYAPSITGTSDYGYQDLKGHAPGSATSESKSHPRGYGIDISQNIFNGFRTTNTVGREEATLKAERDKLGDVEQRVLIDVVTAYVDVIRDKAILDLRRHDRALLEARAKQTRYRFELGDLTRTDVDQGDAALARAKADLAVADANLETSVASFQAVVGRRPGTLEPVAVPERLMPHDLDAALAIAQQEHPAILSAIGSVRAAEFNIDVERSAFLPSLDVVGTAEQRWDPDFYPNKTDLTSGKVVGRLTFPIYDRGLTYASVHRANELAAERQTQLDQQRVEVRASVIQNRGVFLASRTVIASADAQIAASDRALHGVELEETAGQRTLLDVLTAQRNLLDARVNREIAQHDRIIAGYRFLASIGRLGFSRLTAGDTRGREEHVAARDSQSAAPLRRFGPTSGREPTVTGGLDLSATGALQGAPAMAPHMAAVTGTTSPAPSRHGSSPAGREAADEVLALAAAPGARAAVADRNPPPEPSPRPGGAPAPDGRPPVRPGRDASASSDLLGLRGGF